MFLSFISRLAPSLPRPSADTYPTCRLILTYLIPLHLSHGSFPSPRLLASHPRLHELFTPFIAAIKSGNVREYDERLEWAQPRLVGMSVYLVVERAREGCLRMLYKKAYVRFSFPLGLGLLACVHEHELELGRCAPSLIDADGSHRINPPVYPSPPFKPPSHYTA